MREIVLIEDDKTDVDLVCEALTMSDVEYHMHVAHHGDDGMRLVEQLGADIPVPDLIILDLNLPGYSGLQILLRLRERGVLAAVPVIVKSGSLNPKEREAALAKGATTYLGKSYDLQGFLNQSLVMKNLMSKG